MKDKEHGVRVAPGAGFCPGVKKAIDCVLALEAAGKKPVYTIGPLIHNNQVTDMLEAKGITAIETLPEAKDKSGVLVIRAHGITPQFQAEVEATGMQVIDATCPLVKKVHNVIAQYAAQGYHTVIVGDGGHAEVIGLLGYTNGRDTVVANAREAQNLPDFDKVNIVAQTTQKEETFYKIAEIIKAKAAICQISNTICEPTKQRQKETQENAQAADLVIVVGGKHSANTLRLAKLCGELCPKVIHVEHADEINKDAILLPRKIFITAGASTPNWVIEEVAARVKNLRKANTTPWTLLGSAWDFIVRTAIYASAAAACLAYVCAKLQGIKGEGGVFLLSGLFVFTLTFVNRDTINKKTRAAVGAGAFAAALGVAVFYNIYVWLPVLVFLLLGGFYSLRHKLQLFTGLPGIRDIVTALGWGFACVYIPAAAQGLAFGKATALAWAYGFLLVFIRSVILNITTEYKDIILGQESFYKAFGAQITKAAITLILLALTAVLVKLLFMGWKPKLVAMLLLGHVYTVCSAIYFYSKKVPRSTFSDGVLDGQFYLLAVLAAAGVNLI